MIILLTNKKNTHFKYWDLHRKGTSRVKIAENHNVSRQAVSKAIKSQKNNSMIRLLDLARTIGALVEWQDEINGILIGLIPQLNYQACIILIDNNNQTRVFYNGENLKGISKTSLLECIFESLGLIIEENESFKEIIKILVNKRGN